MASSLPAQHPRLALHLTDRALTPIISTSLPPPAVASSSSSSSPSPPSASKHHRKTFTTSPPSPSPSPSPPPHHQPSSSSSSSSSSSPTALSLTTLTTTALTAHQTAKRLTHGAPLRTMIEYPSRGPVILHSYLCPMSLALGTPGVVGGMRGRSSSQVSLTTAAGIAVDDDGDENEDDGGGIVAGGFRKDGGISGAGGGAATERDQQDPDVPMLIATVVAPGAHDLKEARRAAGRLEQLAKAVQTECLAEGT